MGNKPTLELYDKLTTDELLIEYAERTINYQMAAQEAMSKGENITMRLSLNCFTGIIPVLEELAKREANGENMLTKE